MFDRQAMHEGMTVRSADGEKLGKILSLGAGQFQIEKGIFFKEDFVTSYENVSDVRDEEVILASGREGLASAEGGMVLEPGDERDAASYSSARADRVAREDASDEVRMPLSEERLNVDKKERSAGEVRLHKEVVSEVQTVEVPVTREQVRVERVPASAATANLAGTSQLQEETVSMPLREEEVVVSKRPVVREEVRLKKDRVQESRQVSDTVRREEATITGEGVSTDNEVRADLRREDRSAPLI